MAFHPVLDNGTSTLSGKKSWFMFDNEVVCLGAGITSSGTNQVDTTIENRRMGSATSSVNLWVNGVQTTRLLGWSSLLASPQSAAIDGVGGYYFFNTPANLQAAFVSSSGSWVDIHPTDSDTTVYTDNYLKLYFKHGAAPKNATYAYSLLPGMSASEVTGYALNPKSTILANTTQVQAVKNQLLGIVGANFWTATGGTADFIAANQACSVIAKESSATLAVGISDPSQLLSGTDGIITVTLDRAALSVVSVDDGVQVVALSPKIVLKANVENLDGATLHASFALAPAPVITGNLNAVGINGSPFSYQITTDAAPISYGATGLAPGLAINAATGVISGTPTQNGTFVTTLSATDASGRSGYAALTLTVGSTLTEIRTTFTTSGVSTWVCPANVAALQVECWGAGGAGGSALRSGGSGSVQYGGGGAGGAYALKNSVSVVPGATYYINVGAGGINSSGVTGSRVAGGDSWMNSVNSPSSVILAKGGAGGASAIGNTISTALGAGGTGTATGSIGDLVYAGGNGSTASGSSLTGAGGGGSGAGSASAGAAATTNAGATAPTGGGNGGSGVLPSGGSVAGGSGSAPGGGGGGARNSGTIVLNGGTGGSGQVVLSIKTLSASVTLGSLSQAFDGSPKSVTASTTPAGLSVACTYNGSATAPTATGTYTVVATISDANYSGSTSALLVIAPTMASWRLEKLGTVLNSGSAADAADADNDGMNNLLEYALGGDPLRADSAAKAPGLTRDASGAKFTFRPVATDVVYQVEANTDLGNAAGWSVLNVTPVANGDGSVTYLDPAGTPASTRKFYRLRILKP